MHPDNLKLYIEMRKERLGGGEGIEEPLLGLLKSCEETIRTLRIERGDIL